MDNTNTPDRHYHMAESFMSLNWDTWGPTGPTAHRVASNNPWVPNNTTSRSTDHVDGGHLRQQQPQHQHPQPSTSRSSTKQCVSTAQQPIQAQVLPQPDPMDATFTSWLREAGATEATLVCLREHSFTSRCLLATMAPGDPGAMGVHSLAQQRLLEHLAMQPSSTADGRESGSGHGGPQAPAAKDTSSMDNTLGQLSTQLQDIFAAIPDAAAAGQTSRIMPGNTVGERVDLNPASYLLPAQRPKYKDITDYVSNETVEAEEEVFNNGTGTQFVVRTNSRKVKLETVSPMQWCAANIHILIDLLREGELSASNIMDYLAYTVKIANLATKFTWASTLAHDQAYRRLQAQLKFRWGSDTPHLSMLHLVARQSAPAPKGTRGPVKHKPHQKTSNERPVCLNYNRNACNLPACKFQHICSAPSCGKAHPLIKHEAESNK